MTSKTSRYNLEKLAVGDDFFADGGQFSGSDRDLIDSLLYMGAAGHHHNGQVSAIADPTLQLALSLVAGGVIPAGTKVYYKYTLVDQNGFESAAAPETSVLTPAPLAAPAAPVLTPSATGGTLGPGSYYYELSWFQGPNIIETQALNPAFVSVSGTTNSIQVTWPVPPAGADGVNIYRRGPGDVGYLHLASELVNIVSPPTSYTDTGAADVDCNRGPSASNLTNATNSVEVNLPAALDVPAGVTWNLYKTLTSGSYTNSRLASGLRGESFLDTGTLAPSAQSPPTSSNIPNSPSRVSLTDGQEVQGTLPMGLVAGFPLAVPFAFQGLVQPFTGKTVWPCPFPAAQVVGVQLALGVGSKPNAQPVIVDVNVGRGNTPASYTSIFGETGLPQIPVAHQVGALTSPSAPAVLATGDTLTVDIDQAGGGSGTDSDLLVVVYLWVYGFPTTSFVPGSTNPPLAAGASTTLIQVSDQDWGNGTTTQSKTP